MLMVPPISLVLGKIKFISIAFEDFKKSLQELGRKVGVDERSLIFYGENTSRKIKNIQKY